MLFRRLCVALGTLLAVALVTGCAGGDATGSVPASASLAPADALAYVTVVTDAGSDQWQRAERLLDAFPGARDSLVQKIEHALETEGLSWTDDVAPALGDEVVVVATAGGRPVVLVRPESAQKLDALLELGDQPVAQGVVSGWTALAGRDADLDAYRIALARGTLESSSAFVDAVSALPADALARGWVDLARATEDLGALLRQAGPEIELGLESLAAAVTAREDGVLVSMGLRTPQGTGGTSYEPELFASVPDDAVAALSFGGTQETVDRIGGMVELDAVSAQLEEMTGLSLDSVLEALSGEGLLYVRQGETIPEVTAVLAPPDADGAWSDVDRLARRLAERAGGSVTTATVGDLEVSRLRLDGVTISYARVDDAVIATTDEAGIEAFRAEGSKLVDSAAFGRAAEPVGLGERTSGFVYVDIDGVMALVDDAGGTDGVPEEARDVLGALDAFILEADRDGETTTLSGFVGVGQG